MNVTADVACNPEIQGQTSLRWFPKMYFRFQRHHVDISGRRDRNYM